MLGFLLACGHAVNEGDSGDTADSAAEDSGWDYESGGWLYGDETLQFSLELDEAALAALAVSPKEDVHGTFTWEGEAYDVGVHLKGSPAGSFRDMTEKAAFKVDFHQWDAEQTFHGVKRLTLNNMIQDNTMSREHAAYWLFRKMGVPAARHGYAELTVNGELFGLYGLPESMDEQFLERQWPGDDDGYLLEGGYGGDFYSTSEPKWTAQEGDPAEAQATLDVLIDEFESTPADEIHTFLETRFDYTNLLTMWAVELAIADSDGYLTYGNNFLVYYAPGADRWSMLPWGPDQAFASDQPINFTAEGDLALACRADEACEADLEAFLAAVLINWESGEFVAFVDAETARIEDDCRTDPRSEWGDYGCRDALAALREWVRARPAIVGAELEP